MEPRNRRRQEARAELEGALRALRELVSGAPAPAGEARDDLAESAQLRFETLVEQIPVVTFSASFASGLNELYVSPQIEQAMGYSREEWLGRPALWHERLHPDDKARWWREFGQTLARGRDCKAVYRFVSKDGRTVWLHGEARVIRDANGTPLWLQGVGFDMTDVYEAQARVQEAEAQAKLYLERQVRQRTRELERYRRLVDSSTDAIASLRRDGTLEAWNGRAQALLGLRDAQRGRVRLAELFAADARASRRLAEALAAGQPRTVEAVWRSPGGEQLDLSVSIAPVFDEAHRLRGMSASIRDETRHRRAGRRFELAVEAAPNAMIMVDDAGTIALVNSEAERLFGYARDELVGQPIEVLVPAAVRVEHPRLRAMFAAAPRTRAMGQGRDLRGRHKDGRELPVEIGLNPIETPEGLFVLCAVVDISERKRAEQTIFETNAALRAKSAEMEQFVYTVSHDLKSPLVTLGAFLDILKEDLEDGDLASVEDAMRRMRNAVLRMNALIEDLLQLSRLGAVELKLAMVDVAEVLGEVLDANDEALCAADLKVECADALPIIRADRGRLYQILENLLINAARYATTANSPRVVVAAEARAVEVLIRFSDNGPGIPAEYRERIFRLFQRLSPRTQGTGVGLTIIARIMEMHGGRVWVEEAAGGGACFVLAFPRSAAL